MKDCLSLIMMCDDFWVFNRNEDNHLGKLSEGIVAEMLLWTQQKNNRFDFFNLNQLKNNLHTLNCPAETIKLSERKIKHSLEKETYDELSLFLKEVYPELRPVVFIDIPDKDFKYADWARKRAFERGKTPIIPQHVISPSTYRAYNIYDQYDKDSLVLANKADCVWGIYTSPKELEKLNKKYYGRDNAEFVSTKEIQIPKYFHPRTWCLTSKEKSEIEKMEGPC